MSAVVKNKKEAKEEYKAAIAAGKAAVLAERSSATQQTMKISLGNLLENQEATIKITLI